MLRKVKTSKKKSHVILEYHPIIPKDSEKHFLCTDIREDTILKEKTRQLVFPRSKEPSYSSA